MQTKIYVPEIDCDSCTTLISKRLNKLDGIEKITFDSDGAIVTFDERKINQSNIIETIISAGFRAGIHPFPRKTFSERRKEFFENKKKYQIERRGIVYAIAVFIILILLELIAYLTIFNTIPNFMKTYTWWIFYLDISIITLGYGLWHISSYKCNITHMVGMMIGMTAGMQTGLLIGSIVGATNGFFVGAMTGMLFGTLVGALAGKCCGIMGVMEGMMAGVMGGTMGAMITVMMLNEHILVFMPFFVAINIVIIAAMSYMFYEEAVEEKKVNSNRIDFVTFASTCIFITFILILIIIFGPKGMIIFTGQ